MLHRFKNSPHGVVLESLLQQRLDECAKQEKQVCNSHHLLPMFEQTFGVGAKSLPENKAFRKSMKRCLQALDSVGTWSS